MLTGEIPTTRMTGLTAQQVGERLRTEGYNELPSRGRRGVFRMAMEVAREPMFLLLIAGGVI